MNERKVRGSSRGSASSSRLKPRARGEVDRARRVAARQLVVERDRRAPGGQREDDLGVGAHRLRQRVGRGLRDRAPRPQHPDADARRLAQGSWALQEVEGEGDRARGRLDGEQRRTGAGQLELPGQRIDAPTGRP